MNQRAKKFHLLPIIILLLLTLQVEGQWLVEKQSGFKINIPNHWQSTRYQDSKKHIYRFMSSDNNIIMEIAAFDIKESQRIFDLVDDFEKNQLPPGFTCTMLRDYTSANNVSGKTGFYNGYINNVAESISVFYVIQNNKGYIISTTVPIEKLQEKTEAIESVLDSFEIMEEPVTR